MQNVDKRLIMKIDKMVEEGYRNVEQIREALKSFVIHEMFENSNVPSLCNRRFFPTKKDIRNHYYKALARRKLSKIDLANENTG